LSKPAELAVTQFNKGFNCSQAVFSAFCREKKIPMAISLSVASPFGAGIGRTGRTCGAVIGGIMAIGLHHGHTKAKDLEKKEVAYRRTREFIDQFITRNGTIICKDLLGCDLSAPEGLEIAKANDYHHTRCPKFVRDAAEIVVKLEGRRKV